jgi:glyoxylate/hydroxypyruvate reductase A
MQIFTNVEFSERDRAAFASSAEPDLVYFGEPEELSLADREALLRSEVAFGSCPPELLGPATGLRWLQLDSVGCDQYRQLDWVTLSSRLTVTNLRGFFAVPVAETGVAGVLALLRGLGQLAELRQQRAWRPVSLRSHLRTLSGSRALIAGYGAIGRALAERLAAFGCAVETFGSPSSGAGICTLAGLDERLPHADVVFLALPETAGTAGLFGPARLGLLKEDAIVVNLGRGGLLDEEELARRLGHGLLAGAVLDVTRDEPLPVGSPLWSAPNMVLTQHTAGGSDAEIEAKARVFLANLARYRSGLPLASVVDWAKGY